MTMWPTTGRHGKIQRLLVGAVWLSTGSVLAQSDSSTSKGPFCAHVRVRVTGAVEPAFLAELSRACAEIATLSDIDRTASVLISPERTRIEVQVTLSDGRSVTRTVKTPRALGSTLEALLTVPVEAQKTPLLTTGAARSNLDHEVPGAKERERNDDLRARKLGLELGGNVGVRAIGNRPVWAGSTAVHAEVRRQSWLVGVSLRWDTVRLNVVTDPPDFEMDTFSMGTPAARRFPFSFGQVDLGLAPRLAFDRQKAEVVTREVSGWRWDLRFGTFGRLRFDGAATWLSLELGAEVSPRYLRQPVRIDPGLPRLPSWTAGLAVGISWAIP